MTNGSSDCLQVNVRLLEERINYECFFVAISKLLKCYIVAQLKRMKMTKRRRAILFSVPGKLILNQIQIYAHVPRLFHWE